MTTDEALSRAEALFQLGKIEQAKSLVLKRLFIEPHEPNLLMLLHDCCESQGLLNEAEEAARACVSADPEWGLAIGVLARSLMCLNRNEEALETVMRALDQKPKADSELFSLKANILRRLSRYDEALATATAGIQQNSECLSCWLQKAITLIFLGRRQDAKDTLQATLCLFPGNSNAHVIMGDVERTLGHLESAKQHIGVALELQPESKFAQKGLERLMVSLEDRS